MDEYIWRESEPKRQKKKGMPRISEYFSVIPKKKKKTNSQNAYIMYVNVLIGITRK